MARVARRAAGLIGLALVYPFPTVHRLFHRIGNPVLILAAGGLALGLLGAVGGLITLFKGLEQAKELVATVGAYSTGGLVLTARRPEMRVIVPDSPAPR